VTVNDSRVGYTAVEIPAATGTLVVMPKAAWVVPPNDTVSTSVVLKPMVRSKAVDTETVTPPIVFRVAVRPPSGEVVAVTARVVSRL
jgi:hypothetical protein